MTPVKSQTVRLLDIVLIGPLMVWGGRKAGGVAGKVLTFFGFSTILYNSVNYYKVSKSGGKLG